jgi:hypothetical protein
MHLVSSDSANNRLEDFITDMNTIYDKKSRKTERNFYTLIICFFELISRNTSIMTFNYFILFILDVYSFSNHQRTAALFCNSREVALYASRRKSRGERIATKRERRIAVLDGDMRNANLSQCRKGVASLYIPRRESRLTDSEPCTKKGKSKLAA